MLNVSCPPSERTPAIDTLRGVAILLVVALHATASLDQPRLSTTDSPYAYVGYSLSFIRLPLFTVLSGFVYGLRPVRRGTVSRFSQGKLRRLALPLLTLTLATFALRALLGRGPTGSGELALAFVMPYEHLWYLPALAWIFALVATLDVYGALRTRRAWARLLIVALAVHLGTSAIGWTGLSVLSLAGALYLLPSFLLGLGLSRFPAVLRSRAVLAVAAVVVTVGLAVQQLVFFEILTIDVSKTGPLSMAVGLGAGVVLLRMVPANSALASLGRQSYPVYLLHGMGIAVGARLVASLGAGPEHLMFFVQLACGLALPMVGAVVIRRIPWARTVVLGERSTHALGFGRLVRRGAGRGRRTLTPAGAR